MSASIETNNQSDDELFVPQQNYDSEDDKIMDTLTAELSLTANSSEEASSKENAEDEKDANNQDQAETSTKPKAKKTKKKKAKKSKGSGEKSGGRHSPKDADLALLDSIIAQNANLKVSPPQKSQSEASTVKSTQPRKKKLAEIMKEKREAAKSGLEKKLDNAVKMVNTEPEKIKRFQEARAAKVQEKPDGSKTTEIKITREALERFKNYATTGSDNVKGYAKVGDSKIPIKTNIFSNQNSNVEYLLKKFEPKVASGEMTLDEAIEKAYAGEDIVSDDEKELAGDNPMTKLLNREKIVNLLLETDDAMDKYRGTEFAEIKKDMSKIFKNVTLDLVDHCLDSEIYLEVMRKLRLFETSMTDQGINREAWSSMCKIVYSRFGNKIILAQGKPITDPIKFYEEVLKQYVAQSMINSITDMDRCGVFKKYDPKTRPMAITCFQQHMADLFPKTEIVCDMSRLIQEGFAPKEVERLNIFGTDLVAYGIFWSLAFNFNLFGAFFRANDGGYNYYWIVYDRINEDINSIIAPPRKIVREIVKEVETDGKLNIGINHEIIQEESFDDPKFEIGSSTQLENAMEVDATEVLDGDFQRECSEDIKSLATTESNLKIHMKYREVLESEVQEVKEKLGTDDIADISIESRPGENQRIKIQFKPGASEDEKNALLDYVTKMANKLK